MLVRSKAWGLITSLKKYMADNDISVIHSKEELTEILGTVGKDSAVQDKDAVFNWLANICDDDEWEGYIDTEISANDVSTLVDMTNDARQFYDRLKTQWASDAGLGPAKHVSREDFKRLFPKNPQLKEGEEALTDEEVNLLYDYVVGTSPDATDTGARVKNRVMSSLLMGDVQIVKGSEHGGYFNGSRTKPTLAINKRYLALALNEARAIKVAKQEQQPFFDALVSKYGADWRDDHKDGQYTRLTEEENDKVFEYNQSMVSMAFNNHIGQVRDIFFHEAYHAQVDIVDEARPEQAKYSKSEEMAAEAFQLCVSGRYSTSENWLENKLIHHLTAQQYRYLAPRNSNESTARNRILRGDFLPMTQPLKKPIAPLQYPNAFEQLDIRG